MSKPLYEAYDSNFYAWALKARLLVEEGTGMEESDFPASYPFEIGGAG